MKIIKRIALALIALLVICAIGGYFYLNSFKPKLNGQIELAGINTSAEIYFDKFGIPHIYAQNEQDAHFALGYIHAQDRLFQMEMMRRVGAGELAEILGPDLAKTDRFFRTMGIAQSAKKAAKAFNEIPDDDPMKMAALSYYKGVNSFIENGNLPIEFKIIGIEARPFSVEDTYNVLGYMAFSFAQAFKTDPLLERIKNKYGKDYLNDLDIHWNPKAQKIPVYIPEELENTLSQNFGIDELMEHFPVPPFEGSNSWVVGPQKTKNGKVLLSNDTHMGYSQPCVWYEVHMEYPNHSQYGNFLGAIPFPIIGHNRFMAIGMTMMENDDIDFYKEKINPENDKQVMYKGQWVEMDIRQETIHVKDGEDIHFEVKTTPHGPIVNDAIDHIANTTSEPVSCYWVNNKFIPRTMEMSYRIGNAATMQEVKQAVALGHAPGLNIMYGDVKGNIAWWTMAKLPIRPKHVNSKFLLDGASGEDDVLGYYDFEDNPHSENPPSGFVYSANNQPDSIAGVLHPGYYIPEDRAKRIVELMNSDEKFDVASFKKMIIDVKSPVIPKVAKKIVEAVNSMGTLEGIQKEALDILTNWDGDNQLDDIAPTIYTKTLFHFLEKTFKDELGERDFETFLTTHIYKRTFPILIENENSPWWDNIETKDQKETRTSILADAFQQSVAELEKAMGSDIKQWQWKKVHTIEHPHALSKVEALRPYFNVGPLPVAGNNEVINNQAYTLNGDNHYRVKGGPAIRRIIDFGDLDHSISVLPTGQSGNIMSPHYSDQAQMFVHNEFRLQMMNEKEIKKECKNKLVLKPKGK